jgi:hypothetical protein
MKLEGQLQSDFQEWELENDKLLHYGDECPHLSDISDELPLILKFTMLCQFLQETNKIDSYGVGRNAITHVDTVMIWNYPKIDEFKGETKEEAITEAIKYLNQNY